MSLRSGSSMSTPASSRLAPGLIFSIARAVGIVVPEKGDKRAIRCPFHGDKNASAFLSVRNVFYCSCCTPETGWSAKRFAEALGHPWNGATAQILRPVVSAGVDTRPTFTAQDAQLVWSRALARARNDDCVDADRAVYDYLARRQILEAWELGAFGVLAENMKLPAPVARWPRGGYRIVAPLYDHRGELVAVQARTILDRNPKTLFPGGSRIAGSAFASKSALELLRSGVSAHDVVLLGEGLTDYLAISTVTSAPVFCAPGTGFAAGAVGAWARGRTVLIALDMDDAGAGALHPAARAAYSAGAVRVLRVEWPVGCKDACDVVQRRKLSGLEALLAKYVEAARG